MKKTKTQKGITLIALIITIVVLLILAVVAINAVTGDGIIQHATNAKTSYENAQAKEQGLLSYYETYLETEGQVGKWVQNKTKVTRVNEDGTVDELEVGDIVDYTKEDGNKYTDKSLQANQITWAVLGVENGKVLLVSTTNVFNQKLKGANHYINNNGINILNSIGADYDDGIGAVENSGRSINVDDINRITGYNPLKTGDGKIANAGEYNQYLNKVTYTLKADPNASNALKVFYSSEITEEVVSAYSVFYRLDGTELSESDNSITVENTQYSYYPSTLTRFIDDEKIGITDKNKIDSILFNNTIAEQNNYWLASSVVVAVNGYVNYGLRSVEDGKIRVDRLWRTLDGDAECERGVRVVVTLKSNVTLTKVGDIWQIQV